MEDGRATPNSLQNARLHRRGHRVGTRHAGRT